MRHPSEWRVWVVLVIGAICGIAFMAVKIGTKHNLSDATSNELVLVIGGGAAIGSLVAYFFRLQYDLRNRK